MRSEIRSYLQRLNLGSFIVANERPWNESGLALYLKNQKKVYVDDTRYETETVAATLSGLNIQSRSQSVRILFSADAKQLPSNYDSVVEQIVNAKNIDLQDGTYRRVSSVQTSYENDLLVTEVEITLTKLS